MTRWLNWGYVLENGKDRKLPISPITLTVTNPHDPRHHVGFHDAVALAMEHASLGLAFDIVGADGLVGIDIDDCIDEHGVISPESMEIIEAVNSYTEMSPSGAGVKIYAWGVKPEWAGSTVEDAAGFSKLEIYDDVRFFCVTGRHLGGTPADIRDAQAATDALCARFWSPPAPRLRTVASRPVSDDVRLRRASAYLARIPAAVSGSGGHNQTYTAATAMVHGFELDPEAALDLLITEYNTRCQPPWSERELRHKVDDAASKPHKFERGWLVNAGPADDVIAYVRPSTRRSDPPPAEHTTMPGETPAPAPAPAPAAPLPEEVLRVPGFISEVMDYTMAVAPYPSQTLAFCGALCLQAFLAGRHIRDDGNTRTNIYALALAHSAGGKDKPRRVNTDILVAAGLEQCVAERMASGEGVEDALAITPSMLIQTDEIDSMLQAIATARDGRHEALQSMLLTLYTSSAGSMPVRLKAGQTERKVIKEPHLVLFGTAIPNHFFAALSDRMLTNGFFGRLMVFESGPRGRGQDPRTLPLPERVVETARWWSSFHQPANEPDWRRPTPAVVEMDEAARAVLAESRRRAEDQYALAEAAEESVGTTVWGRLPEQSRKLALIYAVSENHIEPRIGVEAATWASLVTERQAKRMLEAAAERGNESSSEKECRAMLQRLRRAPGGVVGHSTLLKAAKLSARDFGLVIETLVEREQVAAEEVATGGRRGRQYRLLATPAGKEGE